MKICCMIASLRMGGAERQLAGLAAQLRAAGEEAEVLTYRDGDFYAAELAEAGVPHTRIASDGGDPAIVERIASHLKDSGCELLISFLAGTNIKACMVKKLRPGLKLIVSERNTNRSLLPHDIFRFMMYRQADAVVCNSYAQTEFLSRHARYLREKLSTIPNFTDIQRFAPADRSGHGTPLRVVTTARLDSRKNALGLIRAVSESGCTDLRVDWYGTATDERYTRRCRELIGRLGIDGRFAIHPAVGDVERVYAEADAFCLPSFYEGTPNSLAEALASGLPALCTSVSDNSRYVIPGANGFTFDAGNSAYIAMALRRLSELTPEQRRSFGAESRRIAEENFSKDIFIERYLTLIRGISGGKKARP